MIKCTIVSEVRLYGLLLAAGNLAWNMSDAENCNLIYFRQEFQMLYAVTIGHE